MNKNDSYMPVEEANGFANVFENEELSVMFNSFVDANVEVGSGRRSGATEVVSNKKLKLSMTAVTEDEKNGECGDEGSDHDLDDIKRGGKAKSPAKRRGSTVDRRRERNRVLARKTRLRKKYFFEVGENILCSVWTLIESRTQTNFLSQFLL